jgi:drug/metabolite transporter (DMT)-like permease
MPSFHRPSPQTIGVGAAVITVLIWASFIVVARASALHTMNAFDIAFCRVVGAAMVLLPWGWWLVRRREAASWLGLSPLSFKVTAQIGVFGGLAYAILVYSGFFFAPAVHASVLMPGSLPLWTTLMSAVLLHTRVSPARTVGLLLIIVGDALVGGSSLLRAFDGGDVWKGDLLFISASFCFATYGVLTRRHTLDPVDATIAVTVFAFVTYVPAYLVLALAGAIPSRLAEAPVQEIVFQMLFQGVLSVVISGITFTRMIQAFGPIRSTMITALVPGLSALSAVLFLGEPLHWNIATGLALVTVGILFGVRTQARVAAMPADAASSQGAAAR